jgi:heptosyltransferase-2
MNRVGVSLSKATEKPLIVRLRNWVGDVVLGIPTLRLLQESGYTLHLVGKRWAEDLLKGEGWSFECLAPDWMSRIRQMRLLHSRCRALDPHFDQRLNALTLPFSFSSALEMRLAGLRAVGAAHEGRGWLLSNALQRPNGMHELKFYLCLAEPFLHAGTKIQTAPESIGLRVAPEHRIHAKALCLEHRLTDGAYIMLCPFSGGTYKDQPKNWPHFGELAKRLAQQGKKTVLCPGPGEEAKARDEFPHCLVLPNVNLGVYAALLETASVMVSNDTGPGHLSAAVGTPTLSVLGPTDPAQWGAWGKSVNCVKGIQNDWPSMETVLTQLRLMTDVNINTRVRNV